ncbi:hypothetical protein [Tenacibaculum dicentrarchi]|uniref:hypothetical protein n=1 Tax=Tenacibaculum dicentrarchi TaxID=669041 RepID=UPI003518CF4E
MKKAIGYILIGIAVLNIIGFTYMLVTNSVKFEKNIEHFIKKIVFAIGLGGLGIYLIQNSKPKTSTEIQTKNSEIEKK